MNRKAGGFPGWGVFRTGDGNEPNFDPALVRMVREYDPDWEFVLQYMREDRNIRQMRLQAGPTALFPRRAWMDLKNRGYLCRLFGGRFVS